TIAPGSAGPQTFFITSEIDTITGHTNGPPVTITIPSENFDTGVPAVAGHYSTQDVLGFSAPGVSFQIQVVQLTHKRREEFFFFSSFPFLLRIEEFNSVSF